MSDAQSPFTRDVLDQGYSLWASCENEECARCRGAKLPLAELDRAATLDDLSARLRCQECGVPGAISIVYGAPAPGGRIEPRRPGDHAETGTTYQAQNVVR